MKRNSRPHLSAGTIFMLLLTLLVVFGCAWFMLRITDGDAADRVSDALSGFTFAQETPEPTSEARTIPAMTLFPSSTIAPAAAATASPTPVPEKTTITIAAAGAVYAPKAIRQTVEEGGEADFTPVFAALGDVLAPADLAIATLETTTAGSERGYGNYNTPAQILDALRACGVDLLSLATERALDKDYDGLTITMQEIASRGLSYAGVSPDGEESGATIMRIGGVQVAVLAYTYGLSDEGREKTGNDSRGVLSAMDAESMRSDIARARSEGANVVIVLPHWGTKNIADVPVNVKRLAAELAQAGADIILGTHPNVPQSTERIRTTRADGLEYDTVVCYSLGSLLTDARTPENTAGMIAHVSVTYDPVTRRTTLGEMYCTPVYIARQRVEGQTVYRIVDAESAGALESLTPEEQQAAREAVARIREATKNNDQEGQG